jgi:hypothetical protein
MLVAIRFVDAYGTKNPIRTACLYDARKIESPYIFWAGK